MKTMCPLCLMLALCQIPKAEEGIPIEVTIDQDFDLIASPIKSERDLSKRVTTRRVRGIKVFRLDMECWGCFNLIWLGFTG